MTEVTTILVDAGNVSDLLPQILAELRAAPFAGIDCETQDDGRHEGLNLYCKYDPVTRMKAKNTKTVFDVKRTVMTGFSIYPEGSEFAYYLNLDHADQENCLSKDIVPVICDALPETSFWVAHNSPYEITMFRACHKVRLERIICTLQMAVSAFGPDEYRVNDFINARQGGIAALVPDLLRMSRQFNVEKPRETPKALAELMGKITAKESTAAHSYNGLVKEVAYSYGLKRLVKMFFGVNMTTFEEVLNGKAHMGQLTGPEVAAYGADDAYWALRLFHHLLGYMSQNCPKAIKAFFEQENPMCQMYSDMWFNGMVVNTENILARKLTERETNAIILREMKAHVRSMLPFPAEKNAKLAKADSWYDKNYEKYRQQIVQWAYTDDESDAFSQCYQVRGPVSNAWAAEKGLKEGRGVNLGHYMPQRTLIYDLTGADPIITFGKTQSDGEARGKLKERFQLEGDEAGAKLIDYLNMIAGVDQRMKLYLTPFSLLMDPETGKLHPTVSSMLASRRMGASTPNPMQLAKRGESTYVRGFFLPDYDDHVILSVDWSGIELVQIGELSADPEFIKAFGQIPHEDLHSGAAADILSVEVPGLTEDIFKSLKSFEHEDDFRRHYGNHLGNINRLFSDLKGQPLSIGKALKYWRTEIGKGANFNFWYSSFLGTVGDRMGWDISKTAAATDRYKQRFAVAEQWRLGVIEEAKRTGKVLLPDGHTRTRYEATQQWFDQFTDKFMIHDGGQDDAVGRYNAMWIYIAGQIQKRAFNQAVNSMVQGSCAALAKRSVLAIEAKKKVLGYTDREVRFMMPIHDELLYSVHRDIVPEAVKLVRGTMIDHPDLFQHCKLDASPAVGLTFEPWHVEKAPIGQIELFEAPKLDFLPETVWGGRLNDDQTNGVVDYLFTQRRLERMAA